MHARESEPTSHRTVSLPLPQEEQGRADWYALAASLLLRAPDAGLLSAIASSASLSSSRADDPLEHGWNTLVAAARETSAQSAREEFDVLFVSAGTPLLNPYASYFLAGFLMEKPLAALRDELAVLGLRRRRGVGEPEDHLGALCEAMRILIAGAPDMARQPLATQKAFFTRHIAPWYGRCLGDIRNAPDARFYRHVADFVEAFLDLETEAFAMANAEDGEPEQHDARMEEQTT